MSEMEKSFSFLQDTIPHWLQAIAMVEAKMAAMQGETTKMVASQSSCAKKKSDSIESIRPGKLEPVAEQTPSHAAQTDPLGNRKRKTTSALSGRASGPSRYRPRAMVAITYDGDMQKSFENIVRAIGTGRNLLRKAKMEARMNELEALQEASVDADDHQTKDESEEDMSIVNLRSRMSSMRSGAAARGSGRLGMSTRSGPSVEIFDKTDKTLERAQELCEKAAHLILRDGDCRKELEGVRKNFEAVLETARNEVVKHSVRKSQEPPELDHHRQISLPGPDTLPKPALHAAPSAAAPVEPKIVDIEVDDDEESDEEFVMPPIRLTSRFGARG